MSTPIKLVAIGAALARRRSSAAPSSWAAVPRSANAVTPTPTPTPIAMVR